MAKSKLIEKIGYGFGDMSSSTFWKVFSYYLPIFYSNIFGLSLIVFTTPDWDYGAKLIWAYVTYIMMMTVYTGINVPYVLGNGRDCLCLLRDVHPVLPSDEGASEDRLDGERG